MLNFCVAYRMNGVGQFMLCGQGPNKNNLVAQFVLCAQGPYKTSRDWIAARVLWGHSVGTTLRAHIFSLFLITSRSINRHVFSADTQDCVQQRHMSFTSDTKIKGNTPLFSSDLACVAGTALQTTPRDKRDVENITMEFNFIVIFSLKIRI